MSACPNPRLDGSVGLLFGKPVVWRWIGGRWTARRPADVGMRGLDEAFAHLGAAASSVAADTGSAFDALGPVDDDEAAAILAELEQA